MEIIDIVDENGKPTGDTIDRETAHEKGIRHRTAHVWVARKKENNTEILLQKRSVNKDSNPGRYDVSSAGHIPAGVDFIPSAIRELKEELGVDVDSDDLIYVYSKCGRRDEEFHGKPFIDYQFVNVYVVWIDKEAEKFEIQLEELESVKWMKYEEVIELVENNTEAHCISINEIRNIGKVINK